VAGGSEDEHDIHMPQSSYWPFVVSIGLLIASYGFIYIGSYNFISIGIAVIGMVITMVAVYAWSFEPVNEPAEDSGH